MKTHHSRATRTRILMSKTPLPLQVALLLALLFAPSAWQSVLAQASVKISKVNVETTQSPEFTLGGKKKVFNATKNWLEAEVIFEVSMSRRPDDGYLPDSIEVEVFVLIDAGREKKLVKHKGTYPNVAVNEPQAIALYLSPREFARLVGKERPSEGDVEGYAVVISYAGKTVASDIKGMKPADTKAAPEMELTPKSKTPFRDLYYDNYLIDSGS